MRREYSAFRMDLAVVGSVALAAVLGSGLEARAQNLTVRGITRGEGNAHFMNKVGIGTDAPIEKLHIKDGYFKLEGAGTGILFQPTGTTGNGNLSLYTNADRMIFHNYVTGTESMVIKASTGNIGIGTSAPNEKLHLKNGYFKLEGGNGIMFQPTGTSGNGNLSIYANSDRLIFHNYVTNTESMVIKASTGNVGIGTSAPDYKLHVNGPAAGTSWTNLSSREFKQNIEYGSDKDYGKMLEALNGMRVARYEYKKELGDDGLRRIGFIAEEMPKEVLSKNGKGVDVYELQTYTIGAMKAQQKIIEAQRETLEAQEKRLARQEQEMKDLKAQLASMQ